MNKPVMVEGLRMARADQKTILIKGVTKKNISNIFDPDKYPDHGEGFDINKLLGIMYKEHSRETIAKYKNDKNSKKKRATIVFVGQEKYNFETNMSPAIFFEDVFWEEYEDVDFVY